MAMPVDKQEELNNELKNLSREDLVQVFEDKLNIRMTSYLKEHSQKIHSNMDLLQKTNPDAYRSVRNVMYYAAFFRYCRNKISDDVWKKITKTINDIDNFEVKTPNIVLNE